MRIGRVQTGGRYLHVTDPRDIQREGGPAATKFQIQPSVTETCTVIYLAQCQRRPNSSHHAALRDIEMREIYFSLGLEINTLRCSVLSANRTPEEIQVLETHSSAHDANRRRQVFGIAMA